MKDELECPDCGCLAGDHDEGCRAHWPKCAVPGCGAPVGHGLMGEFDGTVVWICMLCEVRASRDQISIRTLLNR